MPVEGGRGEGPAVLLFGKLNLLRFAGNVPLHDQAPVRPESPKAAGYAATTSEVVPVVATSEVVPVVATSEVEPVVATSEVEPVVAQKDDTPPAEHPPDAKMTTTEASKPVSSRSPSVVSGHSRQSARSAHSTQSTFSIHVQVPEGIVPGDRFLVMIDDKEYEVVAPEGCSAGEMVAMDICSDGGDSHLVLMVSKESQERSKTSQVGESVASAPVDKPNQPTSNELARIATASDASGGDSVAADAILVPVEIPDDCSEGETFFAEVNGVEYEILVPAGCKAGHLIYLEVPAKHAIGKFVVPENAESLQSEVPEVALKDMVTVESAGSDNLFAEVCVPQGAQEGQNFVAIIDGTEFEVPVPAPQHGTNDHFLIFLDFSCFSSAIAYSVFVIHMEHTCDDV